jgi:hypothetical protein
MRQKPSKHQPRKAEVVRVEDSGLEVKDENGKSTFFVKGSIHYPGNLPIGTKGTIEYIPGGSMSLDWFTPYKEVENAS